MSKTMTLRGQSFAADVVLISETCCDCGVAFAMASTFRQECLDLPGPNGKQFYCPAGHPQHYTGETEAAKLRRERDRLKQNEAYLADRLEQEKRRADHERARANGYKGQATRITKRAKAGVCACCNRSFENLRRHMETKHPDFTPLEPDEGPTP